MQKDLVGQLRQRIERSRSIRLRSQECRRRAEELAERAERQIDKAELAQQRKNLTTISVVERERSAK